MLQLQVRALTGPEALMGEAWEPWQAWLYLRFLRPGSFYRMDLSVRTLSAQKTTFRIQHRKAVRPSGRQ